MDTKLKAKSLLVELTALTTGDFTGNSIGEMNLIRDALRAADALASEVVGESEAAKIKAEARAKAA
jgi:hypothetical protein